MGKNTAKSTEIDKEDIDNNDYLIKNKTSKINFVISSIKNSFPFIKGNKSSKNDVIDNKSNFAISVKNLYMKYRNKGDYTIKDCNFDIEYGDFHVFVGQNGAGKSTIIRMLTGLNLNYSGQIIINGIDGKNSQSRYNMVFVPDKPIFPSEFNTFDYLLQFGLIKNDNLDHLKKMIDNYLKKFEIEHIAKNNPNKLSAGQKQKVLIIKLLLLGAKIIVLDEPTSNLDTITRKQFLTILKDLTINEKVTIFISTHILEEIKIYATGATFIDRGQILWSGKVTLDDIVVKHNKLFGLEG